MCKYYRLFCLQSVKTLQTEIKSGLIPGRNVVLIKDINMTTSIENFRSTTQCAQFLGVSTATVRRLMKKGLIASQKISEKRRGCFQADLDAYMAKGRREANPTQNTQA
jgi:histone H3/H4